MMYQNKNFSRWLEVEEPKESLWNVIGGTLLVMAFGVMIYMVAFVFG